MNNITPVQSECICLSDSAIQMEIKNKVNGQRKGEMNKIGKSIPKF